MFRDFIKFIFNLWEPIFYAGVGGLVIAGVTIALGIPIFFQIIPRGLINTTMAPPIGRVGEQEITPILESKYFSVEKTATPNSFTEEQLQKAGQVTVDYEITITAKSDNITVSNIEDSFSSYPNVSGLPTATTALPSPPQLTAGDSYTYNYSARFGQQFLDSIVSNQVTITVDVENGPSGEQSADAATVTFGEAPTLCFTFSGPWTAQEKAWEMQAMGHLSQYPKFVSLLCSGGDINLKRVQESGGGWWSSANEITIYNGGVKTYEVALYTLAHESGHVIDYRNPGLGPYHGNPNEFNNSNAFQTEGLLPTYPNQGVSGLTRIKESFAESIGLYVVWDKLVFRCCGQVDYPNEYPLHYNFANTNIFN
jgi:hypothetical protein